MDNAPRRHHYVPQFYMRQFACSDDPNKVMVLERHHNTLVADRKSIDRIGYDTGLHDFDDDGMPDSIERDLNTSIETPFAKSQTWKKVEAGDWSGLDRDDGLSIYGLARHLQRRNRASLAFVEREHARFTAGKIDDLSEDERDMHAWIAATQGGAHRLFREGALDTAMPADAHAINVMICHAPIPFRSSTNPTLMVSHPGQESVFGPMFDSLRTWWLTLGRNWGALIIAGGPSRFSSHAVEPDFARMINQRYLVQMLHGDARYLLADDPFLEPDLVWAGFAFGQRTTRGFRYRAERWQEPVADR